MGGPVKGTLKPPEALGSRSVASVLLSPWPLFLPLGRPCLGKCTCTGTCTYVYAYAYVCVYVCVHARVCMCVCTLVFVRTKRNIAVTSSRYRYRCRCRYRYGYGYESRQLRIQSKCIRVYVDVYMFVDIYEHNHRIVRT